MLAVTITFDAVSVFLLAAVALFLLAAQSFFPTLKRGWMVPLGLALFAAAVWFQWSWK